MYCLLDMHKAMKKDSQLKIRFKTVINWNLPVSEPDHVIRLCHFKPSRQLYSDDQVCIVFFIKGWRPKTPFSVFEPILYRYICTITLVFTSEILCIAKGHMGIFCWLAVFFPQEGMEKHCFFFTIVIQAFRSLLLLPLLLLPTAAAAPSCHCDG